MEYCTCGSLIIKGVCSNKNCVKKNSDKQNPPKKRTSTTKKRIEK